MSELNFSQRIVSSGQTAVATGVTATLATGTRSVGVNGERLSASMFVTNAASGARWSYDNPAGSAGSLFWLERTGNLNEFTLRVENNDIAERTYDWAIEGTVL